MEKDENKRTYPEVSEGEEVISLEGGSMGVTFVSSNSNGCKKPRTTSAVSNDSNDSNGSNGSKETSGPENSGDVCKPGLHEGCNYKFVGKGGRGKVYQVEGSSTIAYVKRALEKGSLMKEMEVLKSIKEQSVNHEGLLIGDPNEDKEEITFNKLDQPTGFEYFDALECILNGTITRSYCAEIVRKVAAALTYLHSKGICHRDIKPDNVLLCFRNLDVKLTDFDFATQKKQNCHQAGSEGYSLPEATLILRTVNTANLDYWSYVIFCLTLMHNLHDKSIIYKDVLSLWNSLIDHMETTKTHEKNLDEGIVSRQEKLFDKKLLFTGKDRDQTVSSASDLADAAEHYASQI